MKKIKNTKYAHIGVSYTPRLDAEIAKVEAAILNQQARLNEIARQAAKLSGRE